MILPILFVIILIFPSYGQADVYLSQTGTATVCGNAVGGGDNSTYMSPTQAVSSACGGGIAYYLKAGDTFTTSVNWNSILLSGTSGAYTQLLCETDRTCTLKHEPAVANTFGLITISTGTSTNRNYIQIGDVGHGIVFDGTNCSASQCHGIFVRNGSSSTNLQGIKIINNTFSHMHYDNIAFSQNTSNGAAYEDVLIEYNVSNRLDSPGYTAQGPPHGIYIKSHSAIVRYNTFYSPGTTETGGAQSAAQCYLPCNNLQFYNNILIASTFETGMIIASGSNNLSRNNIIIVPSGGSSPDSCQSTGASATNTKWYHNLCRGFANWITTASNAGTGTELRNSICITGASCTVNDVKGGLTQSGNASGVATNNFANATSDIYTLVAGSSLINAGTAITGYSYNGSNPDRGPYETVEFSTCEVQSGATSIIRATFTNNVNPPMLPATGATTFTARRNGANNALTGSVDRSGDGIFLVPVTTGYAGGNTVDISWASGNLTDSAMIGGTSNQPYVGTLSNESCTNNAGGGTYTYTQSAYELHYKTGTEASPVILPYGFASTGAAENFANYRVVAGGKIRVRFSIVCGGSDCPSTGFYLFRSTGGGYTQLSDSFGASAGFKFCGISTDPLDPANGAATTNQLSTAGTFVPGGMIFTSNAIPTITGLNNGYKTELEYCVDVRDTASGFVDLRVYKQDGTALDTYTVTPRLIITSPAAGGSGM